MARKKVVLAFIEKKAARWATFKKRRCGLIKKMEELITLVGTKGCLLIYYPDEQPTTWPSKEVAVKYVEDYRAIPEMDRTKNMADQTILLNNMIIKLHKKLEKARADVRKLELAALLVDVHEGRRILDEMELEDVTALQSFIEEKLKELAEAEAEAEAEHGHGKRPVDEAAPEAAEETMEDGLDDIEKEILAAAGIMEMANPSYWSTFSDHMEVGESSSMAAAAADAQPPEHTIVDDKIFHNDP